LLKYLAGFENFVVSSKQLCRTLKYFWQCRKMF